MCSHFAQFAQASLREDDMSSRGWAAFRHRDFRLFCAARFMMVLATQVQNVAVAWLVYDVSQSALALGLVGLASFLPTAALVLVTGLVADRYDRRRVLLTAYGAMALVAFGLWLQADARAPRLWPIYMLVIGFGAARAFGNPAGQALVPSLVPPEDFGNAVAWNSSSLQFATISGPALGGILFALDTTAPFLVAAFCFASAALLLALVRPRGASAPREPVTWNRLLAGLGFIRAKRVVLGAISLDLFAVLFGGATALMPIFARDVFEVGPTGLGMMRSMPAVGALLMALTLAHSSLLAHRVGLRMLGAVAVFGLATIGFGLSRSFPLTLILLAVIGAADMVSVVVRQTLVQAETPDELRGRVSAVNTLFIGASNELGEFEAGTLAWLVGATPAGVIGGACTIGIAALWARWFPELRGRDQLVAAQPHANQQKSPAAP
jgi:MFS family permease